MISVKAKMKVLLPEEGGKRKSGIKSGYRPNHVFEQKSDKPFFTFMGVIAFEEPDIIFPGEEKVVVVNFIAAEEIRSYINVGRKWWIYEVPHLIAEAEIIEIF